jgi:hypothetical protein
MSLICDLSDDLVESLLISWVDAEDVGRFDSALCNRSLRPTFLTLMNGDQFALGHPLDRCDYDESDVLADRFLSWAMRRNIALQRWSSARHLQPILTKELDIYNATGSIFARSRWMSTQGLLATARQLLMIYVLTAQTS